MIEEIEKQAIPEAVLLAQLMNSNLPKTDWEHVAVNEIERLRVELERLRAQKDGAYLERNQCVALQG